jgi:hypothetical protein
VEELNSLLFTTERIDEGYVVFSRNATYRYWDGAFIRNATSEIMVMLCSVPNVIVKTTFVVRSRFVT